ncbi:MAG: hypothetical protein WAM72_15160 [Xanthobacteraceae bacterium]
MRGEIDIAYTANDGIGLNRDDLGVGAKLMKMTVKEPPDQDRVTRAQHRRMYYDERREGESTGAARGCGYHALACQKQETENWYRPEIHLHCYTSDHLPSYDPRRYLIARVPQSREKLAIRDRVNVLFVDTSLRCLLYAQKRTFIAAL